MLSLPAPIAPPKAEIRTLPTVGVEDLYAALLADARSDSTRQSRLYDIKTFARFLGMSPSLACARFISAGRAGANAIALAHREHELRRGVGASTINRKQSTLRRLVFLAARFDVAHWSLSVDDLPVTTYRDTSGCGLAGWRKIWSAACARPDSAAARRDKVILRVLHDNGLRCCELVGLEYPEDVDLPNSRLAICGKGKGGSREWVTTSTQVCDLIRAWILARGDAPGPLLTAHPRIDNGARLELLARIAALRAEGMTLAQIATLFDSEGSFTAEGLDWTERRLKSMLEHCRRERAQMRPMGTRDINRQIHWLSDIAGIERSVHPHGIRHMSITRVLDMTNGNVRAAQKFARHANPTVTLRYDDNRADMAGEMSRLLGADD